MKVFKTKHQFDKNKIVLVDERTVLEQSEGWKEVMRLAQKHGLIGFAVSPAEPCLFLPGFSLRRRIITGFRLLVVRGIAARRFSRATG
jgi:hypothetical protein